MNTETLETAVTIIGIASTIILSVAVPLLRQFGKAKSADVAMSVGDGMKTASSLISELTKARKGSGIYNALLDRAGDKISSYSPLTKEEAVEKAQVLLNTGKLKNAGVEIRLDPRGAITVDASEKAKSLQRKARKWRDKAIFSKLGL